MEKRTLEPHLRFKNTEFPTTILQDIQELFEQLPENVKESIEFVDFAFLYFYTLKYNNAFRILASFILPWTLYGIFSLFNAITSTTLFIIGFISFVFLDFVANNILNYHFLKKYKGKIKRFRIN